MNIVLLVLIFLIASVAIFVFLWKKDSSFFPCKEQPGIISVISETALDLPHHKLAAAMGAKISPDLHTHKPQSPATGTDLWHLLCDDVDVVSWSNVLLTLCVQGVVAMVFPSLLLFLFFLFLVLLQFLFMPSLFFQFHVLVWHGHAWGKAKLLSGTEHRGWALTPCQECALLLLPASQSHTWIHTSLGFHITSHNPPKHQLCCPLHLSRNRTELNPVVWFLAALLHYKEHPNTDILRRIGDIAAVLTTFGKNLKYLHLELSPRNLRYFINSFSVLYLTTP